MNIFNLYCNIWYYLIIISYLFTSSVWSHGACMYCKQSSQNEFNPDSRDLRELNDDDRQVFFNSFDTVITDMDATLWRSGTPIAGAIDNIKNLKSCGKNILFLTNSIGSSKEKYIEILKKFNYNATLNEIITPVDALVWHLKHFMKDDEIAFVIGTDNFIMQLKQQCIKILTGPSEMLEGPEVIKTLTHLNPNVKVVIFDFDINVNYAKIMLAAGYLNRNDVIYLTGTPDRRILVSENLTLIGSTLFVDMLATYTNKIPSGYAKPSKILKNYMIKNYIKNNSKRTILIGDSLQTDMKFAEMCGFKKLWVKSGLYDFDLYDNEYEVFPDYQLPDLGKMPQCKL